MKAKMAGFWDEIKRRKTSYLFLFPFMSLFFLFTVIPVVLSISLSFTYFNMLQWPTWVGWQNYVRLFLDDDVFLLAIKNTLVFAVITGPVSFMACFLFAWLINELKPKIRAVLTLLFYAPSIAGNAYMIWTVLFSGDMYGYVNGFLLYWGLIDRPVQFLITPQYILPIVILVVLWMSLGTSFLVFIAGLQGIDPSLYEAAAVDGIKNRVQELWYITLPAMRPYLMFGAIMSITTSFTAADSITNLVGFPSTDYAAHTVMQHIWDFGFIRYEMGYASAIVFLLFLAMVVTQRLVQHLLRSIGQ